ncbi:hypothetical protein MUK42_35662 [Musa troglodytarum]|uniref:STM1-like N-terminal domain-containing protein n=1 Tax=Musa troglodytarum TaxID=320322 RepID=A0A9E7GAI2_9LILI|nr:hypothetical protein MUK42_35662 [Musa troglodytarum]
MATVNPFDLLADDDNDGPSHLIAVRQQKVASKKPHAPAAVPATKFLNKPLPPSQAGGVEDMGRNGGLFVVVDLVDMAVVMERAGLTLNDPPRRRRWKRSGL